MDLKSVKITIGLTLLLAMTACSVADIVSMIDILIPDATSIQETGMDSPEQGETYEISRTMPSNVDPTLTPSAIPSTTPTEIPSPTHTQTRTATPEPTLAPTATATTETTATATHDPEPYTLQEGSPVYTWNIYYEDGECSWMGVGGQAMDAEGKWVNNLVVTVEGEADGRQFDLLGMSGAALYYGPGGYEIMISDHPFESTDQLTITLMSLDGNPLSKTVPFRTYDECGKSLILINFKQRVLQ